MKAIAFRTWFILAAVFVLLQPLAQAQSTATVQGVVTDATGAVIPGAKIVVHNEGTGQDRSVETDSAGIYNAPSLPVGRYRLEVKASGMQTVVLNDLTLEVGRVVEQNFSLKVASTIQTVEIQATQSAVENATVGIGSVVNQKTVQEIPLNGRHFVDLALLTVGTVTPPANGFLTAPLRGQGSFAFNTGGAREDEINYMINGINMSDPVQNQITFQPTINTVQEAKIDNSTYSAEYGRNGGAIVNIATRSGTNEWHGELYNFIRNYGFDARNFTNPTFTASGNNPMAPFKRNQFGGDGGGYLWKDKTYFYISYEGLRQRQGVPLSTTVLSAAQRTQVMTSSDKQVQALLPLIPLANAPGNTFIGTATANVDIDQGTGNLSHNFTDNNRLNLYYALQHDLRGEPPTTQGNNLPGFGDHREARRQIGTINDTQVFSPTLVNELRMGYNRIHIVFKANDTENASAFGINSGVNTPIGLPQITIAGGGSAGPAFGGLGGFPQGRGDYSAALSDTLSWVHGKHTIKVGGEYRRIDVNSFAYTPGTFGFSSIPNFINDVASSFSVTAANGSTRVFVNSIGAFATDSYKVTPRLLLDLGIRWDWYGSPSEGAGRFVAFIPSTVSLVQLGTNGTSSEPYNQNFRWQPRVGFAYDLFGNGKTIIRSAYAILGDQPITGIVTALGSNPPFAFPISSTAAGLTLANAFTLAGGSVSPQSIVGNYKDAYIQSWNFNIQEKLPGDLGFMVGYFASKGTDLNIERNYNQFVNGVRPYPTLSLNSPILPGKPLTNITMNESDGNSSYNALWSTLTKHFQSGLQFEANYTFSKSIDDVSKNHAGVTVQDSNNLRGDRGLSDFDARQRFTLSGIYQLPFKKNRLVSGWEFSTIVQLQSGNPINFHTTNTTLTGNANIRPNVTGPVQIGFTPSTNGAATAIAYIQNPSDFVNQGSAFGNLGRNVVIGPGFFNTDVALVKNTTLFGEKKPLNLQLRIDAFDLWNTANFGQPGSTVGTSTLGLITGTRFTAGDFGTSRQVQVAIKLQF